MSARVCGLGEVSRELRAVVAERVLDGHRQHGLRQVEGMGRPETSVARYRQGEADPGALVLR